MKADELEPRTSDDPRSFDAALVRFGFRETFVRGWIAQRVEVHIPSLRLYPAKPDDPRLRGWRWTHTSGDTGTSSDEPPTHYWIPASGGYVGLGYNSWGGAAGAPPGWRLTHKVSKTRIQFFAETDLHDETVEGFGRVEAGWMPLPT